MFFLQKDVALMNTKQLVNYITKKYHKPLRKDLSLCDHYISNVIDTYNIEFPELNQLRDFYFEFKEELENHINREDEITFPTIIKYESFYKNNLFDISGNFAIIQKLVNDIQMNNEHTHFELYLKNILEIINNSKINKSYDNQIQEMIKLFNKINEDMIEHSKIENSNLYYKGIQLQNKLKAELKNI